MADAMTELAILRKYAAGLELLTISKDLGVDHEMTTEVVSAVGFQRGRAKALLIERESALMKSRSSGTNGHRAEDLDVRPVEPQVKVELRADRPPAPATWIADLLAEAEAAGGRFEKKAARVRALARELREDLVDHAEVIEAEKRVQELRDQLERAQAKLREARAGGVPKPAAAGPAKPPTPAPKAVRAWAAANGVECGPLARIPQAVMEKYYAAHPEAPCG